MMNSPLFFKSEVAHNTLGMIKRHFAAKKSNSPKPAQPSQKPISSPQNAKGQNHKHNQNYDQKNKKVKNSEQNIQPPQKQSKKTKRSSNETIIGSILWSTFKIGAVNLAFNYILGSLIMSTSPNQEGNDLSNATCSGPK